MLTVVLMLLATCVYLHYSSQHDRREHEDEERWRRWQNRWRVGEEVPKIKLRLLKKENKDVSL